MHYRLNDNHSIIIKNSLCDDYSGFAANEFILCTKLLNKNSNNAYSLEYNINQTVIDKTFFCSSSHNIHLSVDGINYRFDNYIRWIIGGTLIHQIIESFVPFAVKINTSHA